MLIVVTCTLYSVHTVPDNEDGKPGSGDQDDPGCQSKGEGKRESFQQWGWPFTRPGEGTKLLKYSNHLTGQQVWSAWWWRRLLWFHIKVKMGKHAVALYYPCSGSSPSEWMTSGALLQTLSLPPISPLEVTISINGLHSVEESKCTSRRLVKERTLKIHSSLFWKWAGMNLGPFHIYQARPQHYHLITIVSS